MWSKFAWVYMEWKLYKIYGTCGGGQDKGQSSVGMIVMDPRDLPGPLAFVLLAFEAYFLPSQSTKTCYPQSAQ